MTKTIELKTSFTLDELRTAYDRTKHVGRKAVIWEMILDAARCCSKTLHVFTVNQARSVHEALNGDAQPFPPDNELPEEAAAQPAE